MILKKYADNLNNNYQNQSMHIEATVQQSQQIFLCVTHCTF